MDKKRNCKICGKKFTKGPSNKIYCSKKCSDVVNTNNFKKRRQNMKRRCVKYKGEKCCRCGYNKHVCALDFHHIDPDKKEYDMTKLIRNNNWNKLKTELDKCILICANCHRELHFKEYETE